jgi:hypothetical protein
MRECILSLVFWLLLVGGVPARGEERLRLIVETDAGGDPDDEQSLVRFLLYVNEWDVEGIIANRSEATVGENRNPVRTGLGIVRRMLNAYGECWTNLVQHDPRYPSRESLWSRTVAGYRESNDAINLLIAAVDRPDPRPLWYSDWGTDDRAGTNNLKRALDRVLRERGPEGYARFKSRLRLASHDKFEEHTSTIQPPFTLWVNTFEPPRDGKRWYHRFSAITATAGGFDLARDVLNGHGPLGALYPTNTTHRQKEGDTMTYLYLVPTGMNNPEQPRWGSWAGRYGPHEKFPAAHYFWANQQDAWNGATNRDNTLARWAVALQNDFRARLNWCVKPVREANHPPRPVVEGDLERTVAPGSKVELSAGASSDPDGNELSFHWEFYRESGSYTGTVQLEDQNTKKVRITVPNSADSGSIHIILAVTDHGSPPLTRYRRVILNVPSSPKALP